MQASLFPGKSKRKVWNQPLKSLSQILVLLLSFFPSLQIMEMDVRVDLESLAELQKCWRGAKHLSSTVMPLSILHTHIYCTLHAHRCMFQLVLAKKKKKTVPSCINEQTRRKVHTCVPWIQIYVHILPNAQQAAEHAEAHPGAHVNHRHHVHFFFIPLSTWWHLYLSNWSSI